MPIPDTCEASNCTTPDPEEVKDQRGFSFWLCPSHAKDLATDGAVRLEQDACPADCPCRDPENPF